MSFSLTQNTHPTRSAIQAASAVLSWPSARETELLEAVYRYVLTHGLSDVSLRPQPAEVRGTSAGLAQRTRELALLRGALLDLLATGDVERTTAALL